MITGINIEGFKRFREQPFQIAPLTILAGLNGAGKTSLIHALLLTRMSVIGKSSNVVSLNEKENLELGTAEGVRNWESGESIEFQISSDECGVAKWKFSIPTDEAFYLTIEESPTEFPRAFGIEPRAFTYICAERHGPRSKLDTSPVPSENLEVGQHGEFCAHVLSNLGDRLLEYSERLHPHRVAGAPQFLKYEVENWLSEIATPVEIGTVPYPGSAISAMQFRDRIHGGEWVRATNMGFGVSYSLPIILAGLIAKSGGLMVVENPEAHLHPAGQSRMGVFLAWLAGQGVQVIVETHSDHVLNGIRRAIGEHHYLDHESAVVNYFESKNGDGQLVQPLRFTATGGVTDWPRGFFDQYQIDVSALGRVRRKN